MSDRTDFRDLLLGIRSRGGKVLVVGLGISGIESARFLSRLRIGVVCVERETEDSYRKRSKYAGEIDGLRERGVEINFGVDGERVGSHCNGIELCVVSPGVSLESAVCGSIRSRGIRLISELELGIELLGWPSVIVTGSNGKSTTVSLIHEMLLKGGIDSTLCGNVGTPVIAGISAEQVEESSSPEQSEGRALVVEASSYQLESCSVLKPKVGVLLNISDNHLERHGTLARYFAIKSRLFARQGRDDFAVLNADDEWVSGLIKSVASQPVCFGAQPGAGGAGRGMQDSAWRASIKYDRKAMVDTIDLSLAGKTETYNLISCKLIGLHNRYNAAASLISARLMGVSAEAAQAALDVFEPLEHRLETVAHLPGLIVINDSKSTTVAASVAAWNAVRESYPDKNVTIMIGGLAKAGSWQPLMTQLSAGKSSLRPVICFGQDANILAHHCKANGVPFRAAKNLEEALSGAVDQSGDNDVILLSPGCASFDEFTDFEHRGSVFKSLLKEKYVG